MINRILDRVPAAFYAIGSALLVYAAMTALAHAQAVAAPAVDSGGPFDYLLPFLPPSLRQDVPLIIVVAAILSTFLPAPTDTTGFYYTVWRIVNVLAVNVGKSAPPTPPVLPTVVDRAKQAGFARVWTLVALSLLSLAVLGLAGCSTSSTGTTTLNPAAQTIVNVVCAANTSLAPATIAAATQVATIYGADATAIAQVNATAQLVHPLVTAACAAAMPGSTPSSVTTATIPAATTP